ncbi:ABC transporter permease [Enemella evansiae]|uniref:ABC transporter permease n=1 Tax=Enemella evansiae TaxID=2016499 RepID=UPI001E4C86B0|nr:ABC transporter permease [Enemella evansiae]
MKYIARRTLGWLLMIFLATNITYFLASSFLSPRSNYESRTPPPSAQVINSALDQYNLNDRTPILERWWHWITGILTRWDWGFSPTGVQVNQEVAGRIAVSTQLVLGATLVSILIGVGLGVYAASRQYGVADRALSGISTITLNIPAAVAGLLVASFGIWLNQRLGGTVFFVTGAQSLGVEGFFPVLLDRARHAILPAAGLVLISFASYFFLQRSLLLDNINADYVRTARAKGLTRQQAIRRHGLRTSLIPVATQVAFSIPLAMTGAVITETIFAWQGMGRYFVTSIAFNDVHGTVAVAAFSALMTAVGAVLSDVIVAALDPRVRVS